MSVGRKLRNYDAMIVLTHFKGDAMGGFGGSMKNIAIEQASIDMVYALPEDEPTICANGSNPVRGCDNPLIGRGCRWEVVAARLLIDGDRRDPQREGADISVAIAEIDDPVSLFQESEFYIIVT